jgi:plastocyanin
MRMLLTLPLAVLLVGCGSSETPTGSTRSADPPKPANATVRIADFKYGAALSVDRGTAVTWINKDRAPHTATGKGFDTGTLREGASASHTFTTAGTFEYVCQLHPYMHGTLTVN